MTGAIFSHALRRNWRQILYWGLGMALLGFIVMWVIPDVDALQRTTEMLQAMPRPLLQFLNADDMAALATPEGFISIGFFSRAVLVFAVYAVSFGLRVTANEEDEGILDVLLSLPVPRWRVVVEKFAAYTLMFLIIVALSLGGLWLATSLTTLPVNMGRVLESGVAMIPVVLVMMALTTLIAVVVRRKATAVALTSGIIVGSYFIDFLGRAASGTAADSLRLVSFFNYYDFQAIIQTGIRIGDVVLLVVVTLVLLGGTVWAFARRDIGT